MEKLFQISLHIKTPSGFETYGKFELGPDEEKATEIFALLSGTDEVAENSVLYMDFFAVRDGIPFPLAIRHCSLDEIASNVRIITRVIFKHQNL